MTTDPYTERIDARVGDNQRDAEELRERADSVARGATRAAVLGVNDGLVTNVCLILGVAGASGGAGAIRLAGLASLLAGALSMAVGEWVSVKSQVELYQGILGELKDLVRRNPRLVLNQLVDQLVDRGFARDTAQRVSTELPLRGDQFLDFSARTVFGVNTDELGSPMTAAISSLALFSVGAAVPLAPWFFIDGATAVLVSVVLTALASAVVGGWVTRSAGRPWILGATRQVVIVAFASAVTYGVGALFGTTVA